MSGFWTSGFFTSRTPDPQNLKKIQKKFQKKISNFSSIFFLSLSFFVYLYGKISKNISLDSVRSGRICPANLGVRSCPVRKLICQVRLSPTESGQSVKFIENPTLDVERLNYFPKMIQTVGNFMKKRNIQKPLWLGETSSAWGSGAPGLSDRYLKG